MVSVYKQAPMGAILKQREILDRRALGEALAQLAVLPDTAAGGRGPVVAQLKAALAFGYDEIRRRFEAGAAGAPTGREQCFLMDQLIRALHDFTTTHVYPLANPTSREHPAIVAVRGHAPGAPGPPSPLPFPF